MIVSILRDMLVDRGNDRAQLTLHDQAGGHDRGVVILRGQALVRRR